jgi:hypothetical protein
MGGRDQLASGDAQPARREEVREIGFLPDRCTGALGVQFVASVLCRRVCRDFGEIWL